MQQLSEEIFFGDAGEGNANPREAKQ